MLITCIRIIYICDQNNICFFITRTCLYVEAIDGFKENVLLRKLFVYNSKVTLKRFFAKLLATSKMSLA